MEGKAGTDPVEKLNFPKFNPKFDPKFKKNYALFDVF